MQAAKNKILLDKWLKYGILCLDAILFAAYSRKEHGLSKSRFFKTFRLVGILCLIPMDSIK
jgi:hypothetical protein